MSERTAPTGSLSCHLQSGKHVAEPYTGVGQTPANESMEIWGAREVLIQQIGLRITHSKQSKLYLLPREPEILTAKRDLW